MLLTSYDGDQIQPYNRRFASDIFGCHGVWRDHGRETAGGVMTRVCADARMFWSDGICLFLFHPQAKSVIAAPAVLLLVFRGGKQKTTPCCDVGGIITGTGRNYDIPLPDSRSRGLHLSALIPPKNGILAYIYIATLLGNTTHRTCLYRVPVT